MVLAYQIEPSPKHQGTNSRVSNMLLASWYQVGWKIKVMNGTINQRDTGRLIYLICSYIYMYINHIYILYIDTCI